MPVGMRYGIAYIHKRKEVVISLQVGSSLPIEIVMSAEGFCQDLDYIIADKKLAEIIEGIRNRKDLPADHDFGAGGGDFNTKEWEDRMGDKS